MNDIDMEAFDKDKEIKGRVKEKIDELHTLLVKSHIDRVSENIYDKLIKMQDKVIYQYKTKLLKFSLAMEGAETFIFNLLQEKNNFANEMEALLGSLGSYREILGITRQDIPLSKEEEDMAERLKITGREYAKHKKPVTERRQS